ncbi:MAG: metal ABC transporter ATP-binding protein [Ruminococcaceae bacterium]|nr:metal ABC transporter ATP-binding protein [Oscillospiraceae bacterium]
MTDTSYITCKNVSFSYDGKTAVSDISFNLNKGDYLCILGENGTGKSTIIKGLLGLIKPASGEVIYSDVKHTEIGYLPQIAEIPKDFPASVYEAVLSGRCEKLGKSPFFSSKDRRVAKKNMRLLGIEKLKNKGFSTLSGGQKQRVLLARALCATEKILLLDEPVSGLDPIVTAEMYQIISELNKKHGISIIMISHDTKTAAEYATHILHIKKRPLFFGSAEEYKETELYHAFLGGCGHEHH